MLPPNKVIIRNSCKALLSIAIALNVACSNKTGKQMPGPGNNGTSYRVETLLSGGPLHGAKGIRFGPDGKLYVCSVAAQSIFTVNVATGETATAVGAPDGESDDVAFAPDGTMAWTALPSAEIRALQPGGKPYVLAAKLPLINPLGYTSDGRLFAAQIGIDRFLEIDINGAEPPHEIAKGIGHLNSFTITGNTHLYGPLAGAEKLVRIDLASGSIEVINSDLGMLSAVDLDSHGRIYAVGWSSGKLWGVDAETGDAELITALEPPLDNLAIAPDDFIYVSQPARGAIVRIDPTTGDRSDVVPGNISMPGGLAITTYAGKETLVVADDFAFRLVDTSSGKVSAIVDITEFMDPAAASDVAVNNEVVVLSDVTRSRVLMLDRNSGEIIQKWTGIEAPFGLALPEPGSQTDDQDGPIVAEFASGQLIQLSRTNRKARTVIAAGLNGPVDIAWDSPTTLYVTEALAGQLSRIDINDGSRTIVRKGLNQPEGLTVLPDGRIALVEVGAQRVVAVDPTSGSVEVLASNLPVGVTVPNTPNPVHVPSGIVVGQGGVLYLSSDQDHSLLKLLP